MGEIRINNYYKTSSLVKDSCIFFYQIKSSSSFCFKMNLWKEWKKKMNCKLMILNKFFRLFCIKNCLKIKCILDFPNLHVDFILRNLKRIKDLTWKDSSINSVSKKGSKVMFFELRNLLTKPKPTLKRKWGTRGKKFIR